MLSKSNAAGRRPAVATPGGGGMNGMGGKPALSSAAIGILVVDDHSPRVQAKVYATQARKAAASAALKASAASKATQWPASGSKSSDWKPGAVDSTWAINGRRWR